MIFGSKNQQSFGIPKPQSYSIRDQSVVGFRADFSVNRTEKPGPSVFGRTEKQESSVFGPVNRNRKFRLTDNTVRGDAFSK